MNHRPRALLLAVVLVLLAAVAVVLTAVMARRQQVYQALRQEAGRARQRYQAMSALNQVVERINRGASPTQAARQVSAATGVEVLAAADRLLVAIPEGPLQVQLVPGAFLHVLFGRSLSLNGMPGAFSPDDPRGPAQGDPPTATEGFRDWYLTRAREDGILLRPQADLCEFRPGGGSWVRESWQGNLSYRYLGGGRGQDMGWVPGSHRWVLSGGRWTSSTGQTFQSFLGGWLYQGQGRLAGTLFADGCPLWMSGRLTLEGCAIAWDAPLVVWRGALQVDCPSSTLALAALGSPGEPRPWAQDQEPRAGDLVVAGGAALTVGDVLRAEETGALVLAQGRLVKRGAGLRLAGVAAAQRIELDGVPAGQYVWSGRLLRQPPPCVEGGAVALGRSGVANQP